MFSNRPLLSVSAVNQYIKSLINNDERLKYIYIKGEISNLKYASSGHLYFSLKDEKALISAMMFANYARKLAFKVENGQEVVLFGSIDVYPARGTYQILVYQIEEVGAGVALLELEKLKKKLLAEGLFDESRKRKINLYPKTIGVISAPNSAAIKDILVNLKRRYPIADILVFYSAVQGENAPKELLRAFNIAQQYPLDTLLIGRGGGASEDLSAFNDESLVRAIAESKMPVIACIGHEIDTTLVDYVADKRASTPTAAAELATVDRREIETHLAFAMQDMEEGLKNRLKKMREEVASNKDGLNRRLKQVISHYREVIKPKTLALDSLKNRLKRMKEDVISYKEMLSVRFKQLLNHYQDLLKHKALTLDALNPTNVIKRGYSMTLDEKGLPITSLQNVKKGQRIKTHLEDGIIKSEILGVEEKEDGK
ncbi:MAG: exodeoxyribonuclease VII large subunit [Erysipelotrichia bacterium]|nr:exodeoxyribonuclease VII large subunit [Erysipelotrichia bacterium]